MPKILVLLLLSGFAVCASAEKPSNRSEMFSFFKMNYDAPDGGKATFKPVNARVAFKGYRGPWFSLIQVDFVKADNAAVLRMPELIRFMMARYSFSDATRLHIGLFKTPVTYELSTPVFRRPTVLATMDRQISLGEAFGLQIEQNWGKFQIDVGVYNPANRSSAIGTTTTAGVTTKNGNADLDKTYAARVRYKWDKWLVESSHGRLDFDEDTRNFEDLSLTSLAAVYKGPIFDFYLEHVLGDNIKQVANLEQKIYTLHTGYRIDDHNQIVARVSNGVTTGTSVADQNLTNYLFGYNITLPGEGPPVMVRLDYIAADGDTATWNGVGGATVNKFAAQLQMEWN